MFDHFVLCGRCSRHVKTLEEACPFCGETLSSTRPSTGEPFRRMAAAAAVAAGVATVTGCSPPSVGVYYGSPSINPAPIDSDGGGASDASDGGTDAPSAVAFYGIANPLPVDAGVGDADGPEVATERDDATG